MPFPELNLKQAWLIPSADALPNPNGTAPGWFVGRPDGRVIVALPGPPREMRPMWADEVVPRLHGRGLGAEVAARTYRLAGIGESQVAELLGEPMLRATNPIVATYARAEAVDVRISAVGGRGDDGRRRSSRRPRRSSSSSSASTSGRPATTTWSEAIGTRLGELGWTLAVVEIGTGGSLDGAARRRAVAALRRVDRGRRPRRDRPRRSVATRPTTPTPAADDVPDGLVRFARRARELGGADVGLAVRARPRTGDTAVSIAIVTPSRRAARSDASCS